jgi:hypothetical protein
LLPHVPVVEEEEEDSPPPVMTMMVILLLLWLLMMMLRFVLYCRRLASVLFFFGRLKLDLFGQMDHLHLFFRQE